ncbi:MAG: HAMP domain-containing histidine kinase [Planctomycetes bacterium]|nr:HAMP domain-containing histidine kinase [Planctomycetota bacterium]
MSGDAAIVVVAAGELTSPQLTETLAGAGGARTVAPEDFRDLEPRLVVFLPNAYRVAPELASEIGKRTCASLLLASTGPAPEPFDDACGPGDAAEAVRAKVKLLLEFGALRRDAAALGLATEALAAELAEYGCRPGLVGNRWLVAPGRISLDDLADPEVVVHRHETVCRLMGTAFGLFRATPEPRDLEGTPAPLATLAPYCALLASRQTGVCLRFEHEAARDAMSRGMAVECLCPGGIRLLSVPVPLEFGGLSWPLFAANLAVSRPPTGEEIPEIASRFHLDPQTLAQIAEETRFWVLDDDKVEIIRQALTTLAGSLSREVSGRYATAFQVFRRALSERRLTAKNEEIHEVTHSITHDLRKPLTSLSAMLGLLANERIGSLGDLQREAVETAREATRYMDELVDDLLQSARLDTGRLELAIGPVPLPALVEKVYRRFRHEIEERRIDFTIDPLPATADADSRALEKVLMNLVGNSVAYIGDGERRIMLRGETGDGEVRLTVEDTGIGFPPGFLETPLRKFRRGSNVGSIRGTGLGLSIVQGLVRAHGGRLEIRSGPKRGSTITVTFPEARKH